MTAQESTQSTLNIYNDTPLQFRNDDSIRLLTVLPERSSEGYVQCILFHTSVEEMDGAYTCLSYVWGATLGSSNQVETRPETMPSAPCPPSVANPSFADTGGLSWAKYHSESSKANIVLVNWKPVTVLRNLYDFLQTASQKYSGEPLWIDALCINQGSTVERNHQVLRMGKIYSRARQVIAWIGPCDSDVNSLDVLRSKISKIKTSNNVEEMNLSLEDHQEDREIYQHSRFSQAVENYWNRAWITQELAVARRVLLLFGSVELDLHEISGETLIHAIRHAPELGWDKFPWPDAPIYQIWELATDKRWEDKNYWARVHSRLCLLDLIAQHRFKKCLHGRDRVYSLRYLCVEGKDLQINYNTPSLDLLYHILQISQRSLCFCAALALVGALDKDENSEQWNSLYLAVKIGNTQNPLSMRCSLREICTGTRGYLMLNHSEGTFLYVTSSGCRIELPSSPPDVLHTWLEHGETKESCTAYLSVPYLRQILAEDQNLEGMLVLASEYQHVWKDESVSFVHL